MLVLHFSSGKIKNIYETNENNTLREKWHEKNKEKKEKKRNKMLSTEKKENIRLENIEYVQQKMLSGELLLNI